MLFSSRLTSCVPLFAASISVGRPRRDQCGRPAARRKARFEDHASLALRGAQERPGAPARRRRAMKGSLPVSIALTESEMWQWIDDALL